jgi:cobalt-zinc-cadmium efflux system protein
MADAHAHHDGHDHDHAGDDHDHGRHDHDLHGRHAHVHAPTSFGKAFAIGIALNAGFVALEVVYGVLSNSVALLADAAHRASGDAGRPSWRFIPGRSV